MQPDLSDILNQKGPIRTIGVIGMGYVGIPSAVLFAHTPEIKKVYGFQRNSSSSGYKIRMLNEGQNPLKGEEPDLDNLLEEAVKKGTFESTDTFSHIRECDAVTIAIQTPFMNPQDLIPDLSRRPYPKRRNSGASIAFRSARRTGAGGNRPPASSLRAEGNPGPIRNHRLPCRNLPTGRGA